MRWRSLRLWAIKSRQRFSSVSILRKEPVGTIGVPNGPTKKCPALKRIMEGGPFPER